jgi:DNA repair photolyase
MDTLSGHGLVTGVLLDPVLPYLTDSEDNIRRIVQKAKYHGAHYIYASMAVTMEGIQREHFYAELERFAPGVADLYKKKYKASYRCRVPHLDKLWHAFADECEKHHIIYDMRAVNQRIRAGYDISELHIGQ